MTQFQNHVAARAKSAQAVTLLVVVACMLMTAAGFAQSAMRSVEGKVYAQSGPLNSAVVYLQDTKTNNIKSFISTQDGSYRFGQLSSDIDYQLWAEFKGKKSDKKTISSFNSKKQLVIDLHIKE